MTLKTSEVVDGLAEHLCALFGEATWDQLSEEYRDIYRKDARSTITALHALGWACGVMETPSEKDGTT